MVRAEASAGEEKFYSTSAHSSYPWGRRERRAKLLYKHSHIFTPQLWWSHLGVLTCFRLA